MSIERRFTVAVIVAIVVTLAGCGVAWYLYRAKEDAEARLEQAKADFRLERKALVTEYENSAEAARQEHKKQIEQLETRISAIAEHPGKMMAQITQIRDELKRGADSDTLTLQTLRFIAGRLRALEEGYAGPLQELVRLKDAYAKNLGQKLEAPKGWIFASIFRRGEINEYNRKLGERRALGRVITDLNAAYKKAQANVSAQREALQAVTKQVEELSELTKESSYKAIEFCEVANRVLEEHRRFLESDAYKSAHEVTPKTLP
jgi:methyl-accepting chemotaxis protein